jgi:cation transport ATPase
VADVGVALASYGAGIAAESADVVILADSIDHVFDGIQIARRSMHIARQSITVGLGLSAIAMVAAGLGLLAPVVGAAVQEAIDVAVILNALRAARNPRGAKNETASGALWAPAASRASMRESNHVSTLRA